MKALILFLKGIAIGLATLVPGVSGGTMALILDVYDRLISSISSFFKNWKRNTLFLLVVGAGSLVGLLGFSGLFEYLMKNPAYSLPLTFFFVGVIVSGIPVLWKKVKTGGKPRPVDYASLIIGLGLAVLMALQPSAWLNLASSTGSFISFVYLFGVGILVAVALILPGISTSFFLLALGLYQPFLQALNDKNIGFLLPVVLGTILGVLATTRLLENLMKNKTRPTYMLILGFVAGSLVQVIAESGLPAGWQIAWSVLTFAAGYFAIWLMRQDKRVAEAD